MRSWASMDLDDMMVSVAKGGIGKNPLTRILGCVSGGWAIVSTSPPNFGPFSSTHGGQVILKLSWKLEGKIRNERVESEHPDKAIITWLGY